MIMMNHGLNDKETLMDHDSDREKQVRLNMSLMRLMRAMVVPRQLAKSALVEEISTHEMRVGRRENTSSTRVWPH